MDRGAWQATVHGVTKSQTGLSDLGCICMQSQEVQRWKRPWAREAQSPTHWATPCPHPPSKGYLLGASFARWGGAMSLKVLPSSGQTSNRTAFQTF